MMGAAGDGDDEAAGGFGESLATAARAIIADARNALSDQKLSEAEQVHEVRKAFKRWRALMRLLSRPLGPSADQMRGEVEAANFTPELRQRLNDYRAPRKIACPSAPCESAALTA